MTRKGFGLARIAAIGLVYLLTSLGWALFETKLPAGRNSAEESLRREQVQKAPDFKFVPVDINGAELAAQAIALEPEASYVEAHVHYDPPEKGRPWSSAYEMTLATKYKIINNTPSPGKLKVSFPLPASNTLLSGLTVRAGSQALEPSITGQAATAVSSLAPFETKDVRINYKSSGKDTWKYSFGESPARAKNFELRVATNLKNLDYLRQGITPKEIIYTDTSKRITWKLLDALGVLHMGVQMPPLTNVAPLMMRTNLFAPLGLLFFFLVLLASSIVMKINLHPVHYLFVAGGFYAFHILFGYASSRLDVASSFGIAAAVSIALVVSYLWRAAGFKFGVLVAGISQLIFLVLFSCSFFLVGYTGITVALGSVVTLALLMHLTAKVDWESMGFTRSEK